MRYKLVEVIVGGYFFFFLFLGILSMLVYWCLQQKQPTTISFKIGCWLSRIIFRINLLVTTMIAWLSIELIFKNVKFIVLPCRIPSTLHEFIIDSITILQLGIYTGGLVFYLLILLLYPIMVLLLVVDIKDEKIWYIYYIGCSLLVGLIVIVIFTDNFLVVCIGHILICCILFYLLACKGRVRVPDSVWISFFFGLILVIIGAVSLYRITGGSVWAITNGLQVKEPLRYWLQCCFYIGFSLPIGLWPVCNRVLGSCKDIPDSFLVFLNCVFPIYTIFLLTCVHSLLLGIALNYLVLILIALTISVLTFQLCFEVEFRVIVGYMSIIQTFLVIFIYLLDSPMIRNGLVCDMWVHSWCISSLYISLARFARCYGEDITTSHSGLFYKYPGTTSLTIISFGFFVRVVVKFLYVICIQSAWGMGNLLLLSLLVPMLISLIIYLAIILWRWSYLWFYAPKQTNIHISEWFTWEEFFSILYLLVTTVGLFFYQIIFYW